MRELDIDGRIAGTGQPFYTRLETQDPKPRDLKMTHSMTS
jgi:hypothetical protein